jgi:hypothetical protein
MLPRSVFYWSVSRSFTVTRATLPFRGRMSFAQNRFPVLRDILNGHKSFLNPVLLGMSLSGGCCACPDGACFVSHLWLIEALADLRAYAERHGLPALAEHLETAIDLAQLEIANSGTDGAKTGPPDRDAP